MITAKLPQIKNRKKQDKKQRLGPGRNARTKPRFYRNFIAFLSE